MGVHLADSETEGHTFLSSNGGTRDYVSPYAKEVAARK